MRSAVVLTQRLGYRMGGVAHRVQLDEPGSGRLGEHDRGIHTLIPLSCARPKLYQCRDREAQSRAKVLSVVFRTHRMSCVWNNRLGTAADRIGSRQLTLAVAGENARR